MPWNLGGRINLLYCFFWGIGKGCVDEEIVSENIRLDRKGSDEIW